MTTATRSAALAGGLFVISVYNGYFGGGAGIMVLTLMLVLVDQQLVSANALKNMLIGASQVVCAVVYVLAGTVMWSAAAPLGDRHARREHPRPTRGAAAAERFLRLLIVLVGFTLAVWLWFNPR